MIVCNNKNDYNILKSMRSHGWSRNTIFHNKIYNQFNKLDERFLFISPGYNLRPTEIQAALAFNQFKRIKKLVKIRDNNRNKIIDSLKKDNRWDEQFYFIKPDKKIQPSWFGLPILINKKFLLKKNKYLKKLNEIGIENRPIISGNFLNQPVSKLYNFNYYKSNFKVSNDIEMRGFFIGLHTEKLSKKMLKFLVDGLFQINYIK